MVLCNPSNHYPQNITRILVKNHDYQITAYLWNKYGQNHKKSKNVVFFFFCRGNKKLKNLLLAMLYCRMYFEYHLYWNTKVQKEFQIFFENIG